MSWQDDCSNLNNWVVSNSGYDSIVAVADGSIHVTPDVDLTLAHPVASSTLTKQLPLSGDFEIAIDISVPNFGQAIYGSQFTFQFTMLFWSYFKYSTGASGLNPITFKIDRKDLDYVRFSATGLNSGTWNSVVFTTPWSGILKVTRVGNTVSAYMDETLLWSQTHETNGSVLLRQLQMYFYNNSSPYTARPPQILVNNVSVTGNTVSTLPTLDDIVVSALNGRALTPSFYRLSYAYEGVVSYNTANTTFTVTNDEGAATITINGTTVQSGVESSAFSLSTGDNVFTVHVVAEDGVTTQDYTVIIERLAALGSVSTLASIEGLDVSPTFDPVVTSYTASQYAGTVDIWLTLAPTDIFATMKVDGVSVDWNEDVQIISDQVGTFNHTIEVIAEDNTSTVYTIAVTRPASTIASISSCSIQNNTLNTTWRSTTYSYTCAVSNATSQINIYASPTYATTVMTVNGTEIPMREWTGPYDLVVGDNVFTIVGTAEDGVTQRTYTITVNRAASLSSNSGLSAFISYNCSISPTFNINTLQYTSTIAYITTSGYFKFTAVNFATMKFNGVTVASPYTFNLSNVPIGANTYTIEVTSEDGSNVVTYTLVATREALSTDAKLNALSLTFTSGGVCVLTPTFDKDTNEYVASAGFPYDSDSTAATVGLTVSATFFKSVAFSYVNSDDASRNYSNTYTSVSSVSITTGYGHGKVTLVVTAQDMETTETYTIDFDVPIQRLHKFTTLNFNSVSAAQCKNGKILIMFQDRETGWTSKIQQGYVDDYGTLLTTLDCLETISTVLYDALYSFRATVFNDNSGNLFFVVTKSPLTLPGTFTTSIYKSLSGNGGDWYLYGTVYTFTCTQTSTLTSLNWEPSVPLILPSGRWVVSYHYPFVYDASNIICHAGFATSDNDGRNWTHRYNRGVYLVGGSYIERGCREMAYFEGNIYATVNGNPYFAVLKSSSGVDWETLYEINWGGSLTVNSVYGSSFYVDANGYLNIILVPYWNNKRLDIYKTLNPDSASDWELVETLEEANNEILYGAYFARIGIHWMLICGSRVFWDYTHFFFSWAYAGYVNGVLVTGGSKISSYGFYVGADEWNELIRVITTLYTSKGWSLSSYSMSAAVSGATFTAVMFNQVKNAIGSKLATGIVDKVQGDQCLAADFNTLMEKVNALAQ